MRVKYRLGKAGKASKYREILVFVKESKHTDMGGEETKREFLKLSELAERALKRTRRGKGNGARRNT